MTHTEAGLRERFQAIPADAALSIDRVYVDLGEGTEERVRLLVDGTPFAAMERDRFVFLFEEALIHEDFHVEPWFEDEELEP